MRWRMARRHAWARSPTSSSALVLDLLGERRRGRGRLQRQERWLVARVDDAFDRLPDSTTELAALLVAADADRDGAALWRAFVRLHELERARGLDSAERKLLRTAFDGLEKADHFGLPVIAIAAGAAPARWTPTLSAPHEPATASDAPAGLFIQPLDELEQAAMAILTQRPGITEDELQRALGVSQARTRQIIGRLERGLVHRDAGCLTPPFEREPRVCIVCLMAGDEARLSPQRRAILAATARTIARRGYEATTIFEIAIQAGVTIRDVRRLVGDEEACFYALFSATFHEAFTLVLERTRDTPWPQSAHDGLAAFLELLAADPVRVRACVDGVRALGQGGSLRLESAIEAFTAFLTPGFVANGDTPVFHGKPARLDGRPRRHPARARRPHRGAARCPAAAARGRADPLLRRAGHRRAARSPAEPRAAGDSRLLGAAAAGRSSRTRGSCPAHDTAAAHVAAGRAVDERPDVLLQLGRQGARRLREVGVRARCGGQDRQTALQLVAAPGCG